MIAQLRISSAVSVVLFLGCLWPAMAAPITELERDGTASNNTLATAEAIPPAAFTPNTDPEVFGTLPTATILGRGGGEDSNGGNGFLSKNTALSFPETDVDFFSFTTTGGTAFFDIDNDPFSFDTILSLFDSSGTLIAFDDDSFPEDPGTAFFFDSFLGALTLGAGTHYLAVSQFPNFASSTFTGSAFLDLIRPDGEFGGSSIEGATPGDASFPDSGPQFGAPYVLHLSIQGVPTAVPEPSTLALLGAGLVGLGLVWRQPRIAWSRAHCADGEQRLQ